MGGKAIIPSDTWIHQLEYFRGKYFQRGAAMELATLDSGPVIEWCLEDFEDAHPNHDDLPTPKQLVEYIRQRGYRSKFGKEVKLYQETKNFYEQVIGVKSDKTRRRRLMRRLSSPQPAKSS